MRIAAMPTSTIVTMTVLTTAVLRIPVMLTTASTTTAAIATARACSGHRYPPAIRAMAPTEAVLPARNSHPAANPVHGPTVARA